MLIQFDVVHLAGIRCQDAVALVFVRLEIIRKMEAWHKDDFVFSLQVIGADQHYFRLEPARKFVDRHQVYFIFSFPVNGDGPSPDLTGMI